MGSPLRRLPADARSRGWGEVGLHARAGDEPGRIIASPLGSAYHRLADPIHVMVTLGAIGDVSFDGDADVNVDAQLGNPYLGFGFQVPFMDLEVELLGGFTIPLAGTAGAGSLHFAKAMRGYWERWLWAPRRLSLVGGLRVDAKEGPMRFGGEVGAAPMFWFGEGDGDTVLSLQGSLHASVVVAEVVDLGARGFAVRFGEDHVQTSTEIFANVHGGRNRIYHARLTVPLNEPLGFAFSPEGYWALHLGVGTAF